MLLHVRKYGQLERWLVNIVAEFVDRRVRVAQKVDVEVVLDCLDMVQGGVGRKTHWCDWSHDQTRYQKQLVPFYDTVRVYERLFLIGSWLIILGVLLMMLQSVL